MTTKTKILSTIREHCRACCGGSTADVKNCPSGPGAAAYSICVLWPFRFGVDPDEPTEAKKEQGRRLNRREKTHGGNIHGGKRKPRVEKSSTQARGDFLKGRGCQ